MNDDNALPLISDSELNPVPVFSCHVLLGKANSDGLRTARAANLEGISATAAGERDVLRAVMEEFKARIQQHVQAGQEIPWTDPPVKPDADEVERFIPIHL